MEIRKFLPILRPIGILIWNFILCFLAYGFGIPFGNSHFTVLLYFFVGGLTSFWTRQIVLTLVPSLLAFPLALFSFASAVYTDDTQGQYSLPLKSLPEIMDMQSFILSATAAAVGWFLVRYLFRRHRNWAQRARLYFFSLSACIVIVYFIFLILHW